MAGFKSDVNPGVGTTKTTVFTAPTSTSVTLISLSLANVYSETVEVSAYLFKNATSTEGSMIKNSMIPPGESLLAAGGNQKIVLEENDEIRVESDQTDSVDVILSYLESEV